MIASDFDIKRLIQSGDLVISPLKTENLQPASFDLRVSNSFRRCVFDEKAINLSQENNLFGKELVEEEFELKPGEFCLASTMEYVKVPKNYAGFVQGRSSIGRLGLFVQNAGFIDPGFEGEITLELFNASNRSIIIEKGIRVCQIVLLETRSFSSGYKGKYLKQEGATSSRIHLDMESK